jgi:hypothetical protein
MQGVSAVLVGSELETWPFTRTGHHEKAAQKLGTLRTALIRGDRDFVIAGVAALRALLGPDNSAFAFRAKTVCEEMLRDAGEIGDWSVRSPESDRAFERVARRAIAIEGRWEAAHERLNLARALLARASLYRQQKGREREALNLVTGAEHLLKWLSWDENPREVNLLLHAALSWKVRLRAFYLPAWELDMDRTEQDFQRLHELAEKSHSPLPAIITARDEAAYLVLIHDLDRAAVILQRAREKLETLPVYSAIADLALRRSEIELAKKLIELREKRDEGQAVRLVGEYRQVWQGNPTSAQLKALRDLEKKCGVRPTVTSGLSLVYSTPMPAELWMEDRLMAL